MNFYNYVNKIRYKVFTFLEHGVVASHYQMIVLSLFLEKETEFCYSIENYSYAMFETMESTHILCNSTIF